MKRFVKRETVSAPSLGNRPQPVRGEPVIGLREAGTGRIHQLPTDKLRLDIGGSPDCHVIVDDPFVSALHCVLERRSPRKLFIRDYSSKNGTRVDGTSVEIAQLGVGAEISIGRTTLVAVSKFGAGHRTAKEMLTGDDPKFIAATSLAVRAARSRCSVLIIGETGTGKELIARLVHESSQRKDGPFVAINCGGIQRDLVASELFGHERGSFTGATEQRDGVFVTARGGTLFLDELGELPVEQQPHLLRALELDTIRRVGSSIEEPIDVRVVAATNRLAIGAGRRKLRQDLYHRLATVVVELPALRERPGDIPLLIARFLVDLETEYGRLDISDETLDAACQYAWPGNIRELKHSVHRAAALSKDGMLSRAALMPTTPLRQVEDDTPLPIVQSYFDNHMARVIDEAYQKFGTIRRAAKYLGMPKSTFADRARKLGVLEPARKKKAM